MKPWTAWGWMWISVSLAISVGIYFTHSIHCLWFLLIPATIRIRTERRKND